MPKWFGERPGKKSGDPDSPDEDEDAGAEAAPVDDYAEEEEEEEEEEVNFIFKTKHSSSFDTFLVKFSFHLIKILICFFFPNYIISSDHMI